MGYFDSKAKSVTSKKSTGGIVGGATGSILGPVGTYYGSKWGEGIAGKMGGGGGKGGKGGGGKSLDQSAEDISALQRRLDSGAPSKYKAANFDTSAAFQGGDVYEAGEGKPIPGADKAQSAIDRRFDLMRKRTEQDANAFDQQQQEALQRKAASQGSLGSGAFLKLGQQSAERTNEQKMDQLAGVDAEREAAIGELEKEQRAMEFARQERESAQEFASGERSRTQAFQSSEAAAQRGFEKNLFNESQKFKEKAMNQEYKQFASQMEMAIMQFKLDKQVSDFNMGMAEKMWNKKDMMEFFGNMHGYDPRSGDWGTPGGGLFGGGSGGGGGGMSFPSF